MLIFLSILIGVLNLLILVTVHEFAHFIIAKLSGAYVYEFSVGMGPKLFQWGKKETRYTLRLLPLGGYVSIASEIVDPPKGRENEIVETKRLIENINRGKKALFISAGSLMNLFLAFIFLITAYAIYPYKLDLNLPPTYLSYGPIYEAVQKFNSQSSEDNVKIAPNSKIIKIENLNWHKNDSKDNSSIKSINSFYNLQDWMKTYYNVDEDKHNPKVRITFDQKQVIGNDDTMIDTSAANHFFLGCTASSYRLTSNNNIISDSFSIIGHGFIDTFKNSYAILQALGRLVTFHWNEISGPVGIIKSTNTFLNSKLPLQNNISAYFQWISVLSANLFLLNMMPIPPLDGYKFVENAVEAIRRKKLNTKFKIVTSVIGALLFLIIFIVLTIKDTLF